MSKRAQMPGARRFKVVRLGYCPKCGRDMLSDYCNGCGKETLDAVDVIARKKRPAKRDTNKKGRGRIWIQEQ